MSDSFPRRSARTRRFSLGLPRTFALAPDGSRAVFLRSASGDDPVHALWVLDSDSGKERLIADPRRLDGADETLTAAERARRERLRESGAGIVSYATDRALRHAVFSLGGQLWLADLIAGGATPLADTQGAFDPRLDPGGEHIAFVRDRQVELLTLADGRRTVLAAPEPDEDHVSWGRAEFVAAEEMGRLRGLWWSPDGRSLALARVDEQPVPSWHISEAADPARPATQLAYPAAGSPNAAVTLWLVALDGQRTEVQWDHDACEYLAGVHWTRHGPLTLVVQSRDQRLLRILAADDAAQPGATRVVRELTDPHWVDLVDGVPRWLPDGRLLYAVDQQDTRMLAVDGQALTPAGLQVRHVLGVQDGHVLLQGSTDATATSLWRVPLHGGQPQRIAVPGQAAPDTGDDEAGMADGVCGDTLLVTFGRSLARSGVTVTVHQQARQLPVAGHALPHGLDLSVTLLRLGSRQLHAALVLPAGHDGSPLPVLLDPYGGPHAQRVVQAADAYLSAQWFADQGYAVLITDGRGTPGRGPQWERAVAGDLATPVLQDQVDALHAAAEQFDVLDLSRVAIRGWSFGGYLAALAVLRRPEVFHAAIAGAPVTDWSLYDTHYTERYLGTPQEQPEAYRRSSLLDAEAWRQPHRPLLLIHGLADDNVVAAHTLRLSAELLAAGRPHEVLPLSGVTHMTPQEVVAENLLLLQLDFLRRSL